jgi:uncharacterized protein
MGKYDPKNPYIALGSGRSFHILHPSPDEFTSNDIAHGLSNICRYTGHTDRFYSVAQHCCHVHDVLPLEYRLWGLLHDASEAFIGDVSTPLKSLLPDYRAIEANIMRCILTKYHLSTEMPSIIKSADTALLLHEVDYLLPSVKVDDWNIDGKRIKNFKIVGTWLPQQARFEFLKRLNDLV